MSFWSQAGAQPKRNYRFRVTISKLPTLSGLTAPPANGVMWWAKAVTLPSFDVSNAEVHHFDNRYYFPGRVTWNPVSLTLTDPVSPDAAEITSRLLENSDYDVPANDGAKKATLNREQSITTIGDVIIEVLQDKGGTADFKVVEKWTLKNAFIESAKYGDLAYDNDELKTIEMTLRYDVATHNIDSSTGTGIFNI